MTKKLVKVGKFGRAHGIKGQIKLISFSDQIFSYPFLLDKFENKYLLKKLSVKDDNFIVSFNDNISRDLAEKKTGLELFVTRDMLPEADEGSYYHADLIGMMLLNEAKQHVADIIAVHNFGAGDIIEVKYIDNDRQEYLSFNDEFIVEIDLKQNYLQYKFF